MLKFLRVSIMFIIIINPSIGGCTYNDEKDEVDLHIEKSKKLHKKRDLPSLSEEQKKKKMKSVVSEEDVILKPGKGTKESGGGTGGHYWNIFANDKRAGKVFINLIDEELLGKHPSLQIFLNKNSQGKHIGRYAYSQACLLSQYDTIYAHMSKKNISSIKSAIAAGFIEVFADITKQVIMQWTRKKKLKKT
jgi:hypothetical protein